ncbi:uncharacterized protein BXZ73DRAFT_97691 [Epithele typhae]|uniref:uncharacterized protein n=1 Tax=Epithele typhae TaxID=378194 RepID=UPI0020083DF4|nr:uncharacterized protein BXZ73DRAFT_97691 [Epithele typhae]KAH9942275.1 hypothetical protein BXZ73DRAFT_97691 [Epithele typhae]
MTTLYSLYFSLVHAFVGLWLTQIINRRPRLLGTWIAVFCTNVGLILSTAVYEQTGSKSAGVAAVAMVWVYNGAFFLSCSSIFFTAYANPVAMRSIGWKLYRFYTAILVVTGILIYFVIVETRGYTLQKIGELFDGKRVHLWVKSPVDDKESDGPDDGEIRA